MTSFIKGEIIDIIIMIYAGFAIMLIFETKKSIAKKLGFSRRVSIDIDIACYVFSGILAGNFLYYCSYGKVTIHSILALITGVLLWKKFLYGIIDKGN